MSDQFGNHIVGFCHEVLIFPELILVDVIQKLTFPLDTNYCCCLISACAALSLFVIHFQTLADKIAVSCSLVRGEYNRAWNEVLLPDQDYTVSIGLYFIHYFLEVGNKFLYE